MGKKEFENFLKQEGEHKEAPEFDPESRKKEFISYVNALFEQVENWLAPYVKEGKVQLQKGEKITLYEDLLGSYEIDQLIICIGNNTVSLRPVGTILIGTRGRVDLRGPVDKVKFILADKSAKAPKFEFHESQAEKGTRQVKEQPQVDYQKSTALVWKIATEPPNVQYTDLDQDIFLDKLIEVING